MRRILPFAAIAGLLLASSPALAEPQTSMNTPGHKMQTMHPDPHARGAAHGASKLTRGHQKLTPGHRMQLAHPKPHTRGMARGASNFTPSR